MNTTSLKRTIGLAVMAAAVTFAAGAFTSVSAQRDPFSKPSFMRQREPAKAGAKSGAAKSTTPVNYGPPVIEARIEYYKRLREQAVANGQPVPKVTSVLLVNELAVNGIFKTPRGWAARRSASARHSATTSRRSCISTPRSSRKPGRAMTRRAPPMTRSAWRTPRSPAAARIAHPWART